MARGVEIRKWAVFDSNSGHFPRLEPIRTISPTTAATPTRPPPPHSTHFQGIEDPWDRFFLRRRVGEGGASLLLATCRGATAAGWPDRGTKAGVASIMPWFCP